ncbi:MAG: hypothetical protein U5R49_05745 [Deltaproteobacteria bacterium]|nr:hypothetical protein [Deltaproteobacteria bacterium]
MNDSSFQLDEEAKRLFQELGGIDTREQDISPRAMGRLAGSLDEEEEQLDPYRILLVEMVHHLSAFLMESYYWEGVRSATDTFDQLTVIFSRLRQMPGSKRDVLIRYRGVPSGRGRLDERYDYMMRFGYLQMDTDIAMSMIRRMGIRMSHISGRLSRAFEGFHKHGINNLRLRLPDRTPESLKRLWTCFMILPQYQMAAEKKQDIKITREDKTAYFGIVYDEHRQPDPNLTMTAALSQIKASSMQGLVGKVATWMARAASQKEGFYYPSVYEAIFDNESLREKLVKPPIEINNLKWLMLSGDQTVVSRAQAELAGIVTHRFQDRPQAISKILDSVYARDYGRIGPTYVGERVQMTSDLMSALEEAPQYSRAQKDVASHVNRGFDHIRDSVFDRLQVRRDNIIVETESGDRRLIEKVHAKVLDFVKFYKARSGTRRKMKEVVRHVIDFDAQDYRVLARDFGISIEEARGITELLKNCFDGQGRFLRKNFESSIKAFATYEQRVFSFLWHYLQETLQRDDRVAFLNSLQTLIVELQQRPKALAILIQDFLSEPSQISYSDRNAMMLSNMLIRKYNMELHLHIEITPEEVLKVKAGLDLEATQAVLDMLDMDQKPFLDKMRTIRKRVTEGLVNGKEDEEKRPLKYLLLLTRELYILLSLVGGGAAQMVLRSAVREYANPDAEIYHLKGSREHMGQLIQHLTIALKGLGRIGRRKDLALLHDIHEAKEGFDEMSAWAGKADLFEHILTSVQECERAILERMK